MINSNVPSVGGILDEFKSSVWQQFFLNIAQIFKNGDYLIQYKVNQLPPSAKEGFLLYATDGRKVGEGAGAGTGVPVYFSNGQWRVFSTDLQVAA